MFVCRILTINYLFTIFHKYFDFFSWLNDILFYLYFGLDDSTFGTYIFHVDTYGKTENASQIFLNIFFQK